MGTLAGTRGSDADATPGGGAGSGAGGSGLRGGGGRLPGPFKAAGLRAQDAAALALATRIRTQDPALLDRLAELGVVRQAWIDDPANLPAVAAARPFDVLQRALAAQADRAGGSVLGRSLARLIIGAVDAVGTAAPASNAPIETTLCFTDLEGFTLYTADRGDEQAGALLTEHYRASARLARRRGGQVVKRLGDGLLLRFGSAEDGVRAALDLVDAAPVPLRVRAGLHHGTVLASADEVLGHAVNTAARVADAARGGQVLVTDEVAARVQDTRGLTFSAGRRRRFKGLPDAVVVRVVRRST